MPYYRKLQSGIWQATIRHPSGQRFTRTDPLKRVVREWAEKAEADMKRGEFIDPSAGKITLAEWWAKWSATRRIEPATADKDGSWWRNHIDPAFGKWPIASIKSWDVETWVKAMTIRKVGPETVASSLRLLKQLLNAAVNGSPQLLAVNHAAQVEAPAPPKPVDRFLTRDEADRLLEQFTGESRVFVEMLIYTGLRWSELAGLKRWRVNLLRKRLQVKQVRDRRGNEKEPKSEAGVRLVPLTDELVVSLSRLIPEPNDALVFTSPEGQPIRYSNWLRRVWAPALERAGLDDPQPTPHDLRHTYGSWLGEAGVPPKQIAALMGHRSLRSVERYIHETEARFEQAREALKPLPAARKRASPKRHEH